jgi:hypothetical protein
MINIIIPFILINLISENPHYVIELINYLLLRNLFNYTYKIVNFVAIHFKECIKWMLYIITLCKTIEYNCNSYLWNLDIVVITYILYQWEPYYNQKKYNNNTQYFPYIITLCIVLILLWIIYYLWIF